MKNRLQNLSQSLQKFETGRMSLPEIAGEFVRLFEEINSKAEKISSDHKEEFATQSVEMLHQLVSLINPYIEVVALGEENLRSSLDNPNYFDAEDWKSAAEAKQRIGELAPQASFSSGYTSEVGRVARYSQKRQETAS